MLAEQQLLQGLVAMMDIDDTKGTDEEKWRARLSASGTLLKVMQHSDPANKQVSALPGFIKYLVRQLNSTVVPVTVAAARMMELVALLPEGGRAVVQEGGCLERVSWLLNVTQYTNREGLFDTTMNSLKRLASHPENAEDIIILDALNNRYGVMYRLSQMLQFAPDPGHHVLACEVLAILAEQAKTQQNGITRDSIEAWCQDELDELVVHEDEQVGEAAEKVLWLLEW